VFVFRVKFLRGDLGVEYVATVMGVL
jgi:hypothetical protein